MNCKNCKDEILICENCEQDFEIGEDILCVNIGDKRYHIHEECMEDVVVTKVTE